MKTFHRPQPSQEHKLEILHFSYNPKVHYHLHKTLTLDPTLCKMNLVYNNQSYRLEINFNTFLPTKSRSSKQLLPLWLLKEAEHYLSLTMGWMTEWSEFESWYSEEFSLLHIVQTSSGAHPTSQLTGTRGSFTRSKSAGA
jgi:hypothetical protein